MPKTRFFQRIQNGFFDVLGEVEKRVDISGYSVSEARIFGYISELLMDVWIEQNQIDYVELPVMFMGNQNMVKKIWMFVARKFGFVKQP